MGLKIYDEIYDLFIDLISGKVSEVVLNLNDIRILDEKFYWKDADSNLVRTHTPAEVLSYLCLKNNIMQKYDPVRCNYIFKKDSDIK